MRRYTTEELRARFKEMGYQFPEFHVIGVRSNADVPDRFDDSIYLYDNGELLYFEKATTNPGAHWLQNFLNKSGTAVLKLGQYINTWIIGKHQGLYKALVQIRPVTVWRDADKDLKSETGKEDTGMFGINIHRANPSITSVLIGKWSAGCQVLANPVEFDTLISRCERSAKTQFTYTLLQEF